MPTKKKKELPAVIRLSDLKPVEFVSSGVPEIDELVGGFPRARITEVYGMQGVGKTSLMTMCLANMSKDSKLLFVDVENAINPARIDALGAQSNKIDYSNLYVLEEVAELVLASVDKYDVIVVDSVAAMTMMAEDQGEVGQALVGLKARLMGQWLRKLTGKLGKSSCALVFINQERESMILYGNPTFTPGGRALLYATSLRIKLSTTKADRLDGGHWVNFEVTKSKVSPPHGKGRFKLSY